MSGLRYAARVRWILITLVAAVVITTTISSERADAATFSFSYDWAGAPSTGYVGWQRTDQLPAPGPDPPFTPPYYASLRGTAGAGIRLRPSPAADGTRDRVYSNYDPSTQSGGPKINEIFTAPGTTTIARARVRDVSFLNASEGQILRAAIINQDGMFFPESAYGLDDGTPPPGPFLPGIPYNNVALPELSWPGYATGIPSRLELSLRTICVPAGSCPLVHFDAGGTPLSSGRFGSIVLDLVDHEAPMLSLGGSLAANSGWVNTNRAGRVTLDAQDPGSGLRRLRLERRTAGATAVLLNETIACDLSHSDPPADALPGGACPAHASRGVSQNVSQNGVVTFAAVATDLSGETVSKQFQVRIDRQRPTVKLAGEVRALQGRWTNRTDGVTASISGTDALSGVSSFQLIASGAASGPVAAAVVCIVGSGPSARCPSAATAAATLPLGDLHDGRTLLRPRAIDLATNRSATAPAVTLLLDRRAPGAPRNLRLVRTQSGARATFSRPGGDGGSPITTTEVRTAVGAAALGAWRATRATSITIGGRATQSIHAEARTVDAAGNRSRTIRVDLPARSKAASGRPACHPSRTCSRTPQRKSSFGSKLGKKIKAAKADNDNGVTCPIHVGTAGDRDLPQDALQFKAQNINKGVRVTLGDRLGDGTAVCGAKGIIEVMQGAVTLVHLPGRRRVAGPKSISYFNIPGVKGSGIGELRFDCQPSLDDWQSYELRSPGFTGAAIRPDERQVPIIPRRQPTTLTLRLHCPSTYKRHEYEIAAWNDLAAYNPATGFLSTVVTDRRKLKFARTVLRNAILGGIPGGPSTAWQAHHIIPLRDMSPNGHLVVPAAFRCRLYPNQIANGVFLRADAYNEGGSLYASIPKPDRRRTWHPFTQGRYLDDYFLAVRRVLARRAIDNTTGACRNSPAFRTALADVKQDLERGTFLPKRPER